MAQCYIILGCARSGTSVTAGLMHRLGVVMGWELESEDGKPRFDWPDPHPMNPDGFYCDAPIENALYQIWENDYPPVGTVVGKDQLAEFRRLVEMRASRGHSRWGIKASQMPWVLDELFAGCRDEIRFVVTRRDPVESVRSIHKWFDTVPLQQCEEWVSRVNGQIAAVLGDSRYAAVPRHVVDFAELHDRPERTVRGLAAFVGGEVTAEALRFVNPSLRRIRNDGE